MDFREESRKYKLSQARKELRILKKIRVAIWVEWKLTDLMIKAHHMLTRFLIKVKRYLYELYVKLHSVSNNNNYLSTAKKYLTEIQEAENRIKE